MLRTTIFRSRIPGRTAMALSLLMGFAIAVSAQAAAPSTYSVRQGDTLWEIARTQLGNPRRWPDLYRMNQGVVSDPNRIKPGIVLNLMAEGSSAPAAPAAAPAPTPPIPPSPVAATVRPDTLPAVSARRGEPDPATALFRPRPAANSQNAFQSYRESRLHPLPSGDFFSSGFLTEGEPLPFGELLGPVAPERIAGAGGRAAIQRFTQVALAPPPGASYAKGDTLLVVDRREGPAGYGEIVEPTGLIRVNRQDSGQAQGEVIAVYGAIREGQSLVPAPSLKDPGPVEYHPVANGIEGRILVARDPRQLRLPQQVLFLDIGKRDGVAPGDLFEARGQTSAGMAAEVMATLRVVQVRDRSATVKVLNVVSPNLLPGTRVRQVAKLPA